MPFGKIVRELLYQFAFIRVNMAGTEARRYRIMVGPASLPAVANVTRLNANRYYGIWGWALDPEVARAEKNPHSTRKWGRGGYVVGLGWGWVGLGWEEP